MRCDSKRLHSRRLEVRRSDSWRLDRRFKTRRLENWGLRLAHEEIRRFCSRRLDNPRNIVPAKALDFEL